MMLFYKAWRESRARFLAAALGLLLYGAFMVFIRDENQAPFSVNLMGNSYSEYIDNLVFDGLGKGLFVLLVIFLSLGGLLRERAHRTAFFTLALPVSRAQLIGSQIAVGVVELALLSLFPALLIPSLSALVHQTYPVQQALRFSILWFSGATVIFAASLLFSTILRGEYTAPITCYAALMLVGRESSWGPLLPYHLNVLRTMGARWEWRLITSDGVHWHSPPRDISGPLPWGILLLMVLVAILFMAIATRITQKQEV
jgi:ABC-type transport system involved in multi-copper enzyme maturation permease subunit